MQAVLPARRSMNQTFRHQCPQKRRAPTRPARPATEKAPTWKEAEAPEEGEADGEVDALEAELDVDAMDELL